MKERPILFSGEMVRAILDGRKTQTRRVMRDWVKFPHLFAPDTTIKCEGDSAFWVRPDARDSVGGPLYVSAYSPYGAPGGRLWVRETHVFVAEVFGLRPGVAYQADGQIKWVDAKTMPDGATVYNAEKPDFWKWRPSIHMPRWASRITLRVVDVRVERVQEISEADAYAEGVTIPLHYAFASNGNPELRNEARTTFRTLWDSINADPRCGWDANPWVWVVDFERVTP